jgi:hypothetical protein
LILLRRRRFSFLDYGAAKLRFDVIYLPPWVGLLALFLLSLLVGALVLEHYRERSRGRAAELKALALLKHWLSPAQLAQYNIHGHFEVTGCHTGKRYRIRQTRLMNIDELDKQGIRTVAWCFGLIGDVMLAQKIALGNDEQAALAVANRGNHQANSLAIEIFVSRITNSSGSPSNSRATIAILR